MPSIALIITGVGVVVVVVAFAGAAFVRINKGGGGVGLILAGFFFGVLIAMPGFVSMLGEGTTVGHSYPIG